MTTKISKRDLAAMHGAVDELAVALPEAFAHLSGLINNLMSSVAAVSVPVRGKKATAKTDDFDDDDTIIDDEDDDDATDGDDDTIVDDDDDAVEGDDDASEGLELPELENLTPEDITTAFESVETDGEYHEKTEGVGLRELEAEIESFGFDKLDVYKGAGAKNAATKKAAAQELLTSLYLTIDAIAEFNLTDIVSFAAEADEDFKPIKRGTEDAKIAQASKALLIAALAG